MKHFLDTLAIWSFSLYLKIQGYTFRQAASKVQLEAARALKQTMYIDDLKLIVPEACQAWFKNADQHSIIFMAYHHNRPIGMIALFDPAKANRLYDGFGINRDATGYEVGSLVLAKPYRDGQMIVVLGLFLCLYRYSKQHNIKKWIATSSKALAWRLRRFVKALEFIEASTAQGQNPEAVPLYEMATKLKVSEVCYQMSVNQIVPWNIAKNLIRVGLKKWLKLF